MHTYIQFGAVKAGSGMWASSLRAMHPTEGRTLDLVYTYIHECIHTCSVVSCIYAYTRTVVKFKLHTQFPCVIRELDKVHIITVFNIIILVKIFIHNVQN